MKAQITTFVVLLIAVFVSGDVYDICAEKNCLALPDESCIENKNCKMVAAFQKVKNGVEFMVQGEYEGIDDGEKYVAVGLSPNTMMGNDSVIGCYGSTVAHYWNTANPYYAWPLEDAQTGLSDVKIQVSGGKITCSFTRDATTELSLPNDLGKVTIDLDKTEFYLELATGPLDSNGNIAHHTDKGISENPFSFS